MGQLNLARPPNEKIVRPEMIVSPMPALVRTSRLDMATVSTTNRVRPSCYLLNRGRNIVSVLMSRQYSARE